MVVALAAATTGFAILGLSPGFALSVLAFAAVGAGLAPIFPGLYSMAGRLAPRRRAAAMGFVSAVSSGPRFVTPLVLGWLAVSYGLHTVFAVAAVMALFSLLLIGFVLARFSRGATFEGASSR
jgi:MFS family permease